MRAVIQRVRSASVQVADRTVGKIERGLLVFLGACEGDDETDLEYLVEKIPNLRIFEDSAGKMNLSLLDISVASPNSPVGVLVISQFTLYADTRKGRRPSFNKALEPVEAERLYELFVARLREAGVSVELGVFGARMLVTLENDGPVTIIIDSPSSLPSPSSPPAINS